MENDAGNIMHYSDSLGDSDDTKGYDGDICHISEAVVSFNILASFGFCSKISINSQTQMKAYYDLINSKRLQTGGPHTIRGSGKDLFTFNKRLRKKKSDIKKAQTARAGKSLQSLFKT
eukprot:UN08116